MRSLALAALTVSLALAGDASAHIQLMSPTQRHSAQKAGPCGVGPDDIRGPNVTTFKPGETITVVFDEHVDHPGHFRVSFDDDGHDGFLDPQSYTDFYTNDLVLLDEIADKNGGIYEVEVTLPDIECDNCTLQVLQVMTDKPPFGPGGGVDFYWQCADIRLEGELAGTTTTGEPDTTTADDQPSVAADPGTGTAVGTIAETGADASSTAADDTAAEPTTTPAPDPTTGSASSTGGDTGLTTTTSPNDTVDDKGCGCRSDAPGAGWLALLVPLAWRRRRA